MDEIYKPNNAMDFKKFITKISEKEYNIYIVGDIVEDFTNYIDLYELLEKKDLTINFIIKTLGGDIYSALTLYEAINNSKCKTKAIVFNARSAGSLIMLACNEIIYNKSSTVMIHEPQFIYSKNNLSQVKSYIEYMDKVWKRVLTIYETKFDKNIKEKISKNKEVFYTYEDLN